MFRAVASPLQEGVVVDRWLILVNPFSKTHGAPDDEERHVGDLGNLHTDDNGEAKGTLEDRLIKLIGPESVVGVRTFPVKSQWRTLLV